MKGFNWTLKKAEFTDANFYVLRHRVEFRIKNMLMI